jgi:uncharacterized damage-inducible protein DinB
VIFKSENMTEINRILDQMDRAFSGEAWHGPSLQAVLDGITAEDASKHPVREAHSIWELVNHVGVWNKIVRQRLMGEVVAVNPEIDWPPVWEVSDVEWKRTLEDLKEWRAQLRKVVARLADDQLNERVVDEEYTTYFMLHGLIQHDLYHAGQIAILKKALR